MKGQVLTPPRIVIIMIEKLFQKRNPRSNDRVLDPGCGDGTFIKGILEWCQKNGIKSPQITGVESDIQIFQRARESLRDYENVTLINKDFLLNEFGTYSFILGNPPYVRVEDIEESKKRIYRRKFSTAKNRFYDILWGLEDRLGGKRRLATSQGKMDRPRRGVYFFFEPGEKRSTGSGLRLFELAPTH